MGVWALGVSNCPANGLMKSYGSALLSTYQLRAGYRGMLVVCFLRDTVSFITTIASRAVRFGDASLVE